MDDYLSRYIRRGVEPLDRRDSVREAARRLSVEQLTDLPVTGNDGKVAGLFGEKELIEALSPSNLGELSDTTFMDRDFEDTAEEARKVMDAPIEKFMRRQYATLSGDFNILHCCDLFLHQRQGVIPILDHGKPVGLIRRADIGRAIIEGAGVSPEAQEVG